MLRRYAARAPFFVLFWRTGVCTLCTNSAHTFKQSGCGARLKNAEIGNNKKRKTIPLPVSHRPMGTWVKVGRFPSPAGRDSSAVLGDGTHARSYSAWNRLPLCCRW